MKTKHLLLVATGVFGMLVTPAMAQDGEIITRETFGPTSYDANAGGSYQNSDNSIAFYKWTDAVDWVSTNGHVESGAVESVRTSTYLADVTLQDYDDASKGVGICLHPATQYTDALWSEIKYVEISITDYETLQLGFGLAKRANFGADANVRGLVVEYSIDGGDWMLADTAVIANPLDLGVWTWVVMNFEGTGDVLDIRFTSTGNQMILDDITVYGSPVEKVGVNTAKNEFSVYPNPATNNIAVNLGSRQSAAYEIVSISGATMLKGELASNNNRIDITDLKKGVYFLSVLSEGKRETTKLVKQ